jgi:hypothetical protein
MMLNGPSCSFHFRQVIDIIEAYKFQTACSRLVSSVSFLWFGFNALNIRNTEFSRKNLQLLITKWQEKQDLRFSQCWKFRLCSSGLRYHVDFLPPWRKRQYIPPKHQQPSKPLHGAIIQKASIRKTSDLAVYKWNQGWVGPRASGEENENQTPNHQSSSPQHSHYTSWAIPSPSVQWCTNCNQQPNATTTIYAQNLPAHSGLQRHCQTAQYMDQQLQMIKTYDSLLITLPKECLYSITYQAKGRLLDFLQWCHDGNTSLRIPSWTENLVPTAEFAAESSTAPRHKCKIWGFHGCEYEDCVTPCSLVDRYQHFTGNSCLHLQGESRFLHNTGTCLPLSPHTVTSQKTINSLH